MMFTVKRQEAGNEVQGTGPVQGRSMPDNTIHALPLLFLPAGLLALLLAALLICGFLLPAQYGDTFLGEMKYKSERLRATDGPRIVFVGGSSIPFGLKCALVEQYLPGYSAVDFGMYAHMGTVVMLDWARENAHPGDIFLIMPEQDPDTLSSLMDGEDVWQASDGAWQLVQRLSPRRREQLAAAFPAFAGKKLRYALLGTPETEGVYARSSFDDYGDIVYPRPGNVLPGGFDPNAPISFDTGVLSEDFTAELNAFARAVWAKGADVLYHFPPMNGAALSPGTDSADIDAYWETLREQLLFPILGDPNRCILESGWFYDSNYHLNSAGAAVFTKLVIEDLKLFLRDTSPTDIPLPAMPPPDLTLQVGDCSQADLFLYEPAGTGWRITGLSEAARGVSSLVLPTHYQGEPVTELAESALRDLPGVGTVTLQPNLGVLRDGTFRGCAALRQLVLTGPPTAYTVGSGLLDGADFLILVPPEYLDAYRVSYFWQRYAARIFPLDASP